MNITSIIKEEFNNLFLNEFHEYRDDEFINVGDISLQNEYDKLNTQLFNNYLSKVPLEWSNRKRALGHVKYLGNRQSGEINVKHLAMSNFYKMTYRQFKDVMAHEMIHVKLFENGDYRRESSSHGYIFLREADRINLMGLGFKITPVNTEDLTVSDKTRENIKPLIGIILNFDGKYYVGVTTPNTYIAEQDNLNNLFNNFIKYKKYRNIEVTYVETKNPELLQVPVKRTFARGIPYMSLSDELLGELLDDSIIKTVQYGEKELKQVAESDNSDWFEGIIV
jgi:hypothetical protein